MSSFYDNLHKALISDNISTKELIIDELIASLKSNEEIDNNFTPLVFEKPSYANRCKIVLPKDLPKRKDFNTKEGLEALVHSITHIEYSAIDLALDAVYRFTNMPNEYKLDWLIVAQDEVRHFKMLYKILEKLDSYYGKLPVHTGLFEMSYKTNHSVLERMAIIPRYFEATGLDVNPKIINKLNSYKSNKILNEIKNALNIIYIEEIEHVKKGDKWFKYLCNIENFDYMQKFKEIVKKYNLRRDAKTFNVKARLEAGFSCDELKSMGVKKCS